MQTALQRNIRVIPILVNGASMPAEKDLPQELAPLSRRNGMEIEHPSFDSDVNLLITKLEKMLRVTSQPSDDYDTQYEENSDFEEGAYDNEYPQPPNLPQGLESILKHGRKISICLPPTGSSLCK